jgi:hypothetical protein
MTVNWLEAPASSMQLQNKSFGGAASVQLPSGVTSMIWSYPHKFCSYPHWDPNFRWLYQANKMTFNYFYVTYRPIHVIQILTDEDNNVR